MDEEKKQSNMKVDIEPEMCSDKVENGSRMDKMDSLTISSTYKMVPEVKKEKEWETTKAQKKIFLRAWEQTLGSVSATCKRADIARQTYYNWMHDDPEFANAIRAHVTQMLEDLDQAGKLKILEGDGSMIRFYLDRRHPEFKQHLVTEVVTSGKSFKQLIDEENERRNNEQSEGVESGSNPNDAENKEQTRTDGAVQTEHGADVLLGKENEKKPDSQSPAEGNK